MFSSLQCDRVGQFVLLLLSIATVALPYLNLTLPESHPYHVSTYQLNLFGKYLCYALLAMSVDLVWGYMGFLTLGHAAFFGLGGYAMGMYLMRQIGDRGTYGHPELPDFMVFLDWNELPWYWSGFDHFPVALIAILLVPGLLAFIFGWLAFRSRVNGVYLSIISQAMTYALMLTFFRNEFGFGGNNGLTDFKDILGFPISDQSTRVALFVASSIAVIAGYLLCRRMVTSRAGRVVVAIRDAESRVRFLGYHVERYQIVFLVVSAMLAGIAGALYVPQVGIINPGEFSPLNSIEIVIWVAIGGRATLYGAVVGALLVSVAKSWFTVAFPEYWIFALGALFVLTTLWLPYGVAGFSKSRVTA